MLKILGLGAALIIIIATVSVGTFAYFNDVQTVTGNTISAGTLELQVNGGPSVSALSISDIKPVDASGGLAGAATNAFNFDITNVGTLSGKLGLKVSAIENDENTRSNLELRSGDTTSGTTSGELGGLLKIAVWVDVDKNGTWSSGDYYLNPGGPSTVAWASGTVVPDAGFYTVNSFDTKTFTNLATLAGSDDAGNLMVDYVFPSSSSTYLSTGLYTDNVAQSDGVKFDISVTLDQS